MGELVNCEPQLYSLYFLYLTFFYFFYHLGWTPYSEQMIEVLRYRYINRCFNRLFFKKPKKFGKYFPNFSKETVLWAKRKPGDKKETWGWKKKFSK
jgi:hypothetical protein